MKWFKHDTDASQDSKLKKLILRHGAEGYAVYFHCLELIAMDVSETKITFELEHDAEIIADNLKIKGDSEFSAIDKVGNIMRYIVSLGLFEESQGKITCLKLLKRIDMSMASNVKFRQMITNAKEQNKEKVMENHDKVMENHDKVMLEETRLEETRLEETRKEDIKPEEKQDVQMYEICTPELREQQKSKKETKHKHGEYNHVLLTDTEHNKLLEEWGEQELKRMICILDEGIEQKGYKYKNFYLAIKKWKANEAGQGNSVRKKLAVQERETFLDTDFMS